MVTKGMSVRSVPAGGPALAASSASRSASAGNSAGRSNSRRSAVKSMRGARTRRVVTRTVCPLARHKPGGRSPIGPAPWLIFFRVLASDARLPAARLDALALGALAERLGAQRVALRGRGAQGLDVDRTG